jgi:hypothetical protein
MAIGTFEMLHLFRGCCLCGCRLCAGPPGVAGQERAWRLKPHARRAWKLHRAALLEIWRREADPDQVEAGFRGAARRGYGHLFPAFAEVVFDGAEWPTLGRKWPADARRVWKTINRELAALK